MSLQSTVGAGIRIYTETNLFLKHYIFTVSYSNGDTQTNDAEPCFTRIETECDAAAVRRWAWIIAEFRGH